MKKLLSLSVLIAMLWGCCNVEDTPKTDEKPANYIVTFDANGGKGTMPQQIFVADTPQPLNPNTFKRDGYVFTEWNTTADGKGVTYLSESYYSLTSDIKLYAQWNAEEEKKEDEENPDNPQKTYTITYKSQYGTVPNKISGLKKDDELTILQLQELVTTGYTFAGWYNGENEITTGHKITCDLELTAKWDVNTYTVVFYDNGGDGNMEYQNFTYSAEQALNANAFTREGYTFAGWAASDDGKVIYADKGKVKNLTAENGAIVALYAVWTDNDKVLPVIFSQPTAVDYGESVTLSCATEGAKISYTIDGMTAEYTDAFPITKDVIITAFATKDGMKDSDTSIASYTVKTYRVTYRSEYGTEPDKIMGLKKGDTLTEEQLAGITAGGYTFAGWYNGENKIEVGYTITCDLELTAKWNANTYTVKFDSNGGSGEMTSQTFTYDVEQALTANTFTRDGYTFAGWATTTNGEKVYTDRAKIKNLTSDMDGEVTLYAVWLISTDTGYTVEHYQQNANDDEYTLAETENQTGATGENTFATAKTYAGFTVKSVEQTKNAENGSTVVKIYYDRNIITLTLNLDGGEGQTEIIGKYGAIVNVKVPTKNGYTFVSWDSELPATFPLENAECTAIWIANTYTVKFNANGGSGEMETQTFTFGVEQVLTENKFTYEGYTFIGWSENLNGEKKYVNEQEVSNLTTQANGEVILYAMWLKLYTITYILDEGINAVSNPTSYTVETETITLANAIKTGCTFLGWYTDSTFLEENKIFEITKGLAENIILYAKWRDAVIGDIAYSDGSVSENYDNTKQAVGIVISVNNGVATKIVSLTENMKNWVTAKNWCNAYVDDGGNKGWYLPSLDELEKLSGIRNRINTAIKKIQDGGGTATTLAGEYWSTTIEYSSSGITPYVCGLNVNNGEDFIVYKGSCDTSSSSVTFYVRAVRAF